MKVVIKLCMVFIVLGIISCRDTKNEEADAEAMTEQIESLEEETTNLTEEIDAEAKELEETLSELDSI